MTAALDLRPPLVETVRATVVASDDGQLQLVWPGSRGPGQTAESCLLEPAVDDVVLVALTSEAAYVLAVLERPGDAPRRWRMGGESPEIVSEGRLRIAAKGGLQLSTSEEISLIGSSLRAIAEEGTVHLRRALVDSRELVSRAEVVKAAYGVVDQTVERFTARLGRSTRIVEEMDLTQAERVDVRAKESMIMRARDTLMNATRLFKADAEQIHMG